MGKIAASTILLIGSSHHASVLVDAIELAGEYRIAGFLDDTQPIGALRSGYPILGKLQDAGRIIAENAIDNVVLAVGDNWSRRKIWLDLAQARPGLKYPPVKHPSAVVAATANIGRGAALLASSHVGAGSCVGEFSIVNTGSSLDHDCTMHNFSSIAPGVFMGGLVEIGECSAVGVGASISDRISIGNHAVIGTGSVVVRDIPDFVVAYGNPARIQRSRQEGEAYLSTGEATTA
jgi:sugar O-acyltransferase (sialic acid O-acetyltransferase NeuD family)